MDAVARPELLQAQHEVIGPPEHHARDVDYASGEWIAAGVVQAELSASDARGPAAVATFLEDAARSIAAAMVATENDVMAMPEHLSCAIGASLALYALITDAVSS
jgi:hypothetical protein